jgi:hypothetical protein
MYYNCDYEGNCKGDCALAPKKCGAITFSKFKFELAGKWNQRLVLERWAETRWFQPSRWFQGTEQVVSLVAPSGAELNVQSSNTKLLRVLQQT